MLVWNKYITLWLFNVAIENHPGTDDFPIKTFIYNGFSIAMLNNQMVNIYQPHILGTGCLYGSSSIPMAEPKDGIGIIPKGARVEHFKISQCHSETYPL